MGTSRYLASKRFAYYMGGGENMHELAKITQICSLTDLFIPTVR